MTVAFELGKTLSEIEDMPLRELENWLGYFEAMNNQHKKKKGK
jgi:hypothetical protein